MISARLLHSRGQISLLGMPVHATLVGADPSIVWSIPNTPDEESVPFNNFLVSHSGLTTLIFAEKDVFAFLSDGMAR